MFLDPVSLFRTFLNGSPKKVSKTAAEQLNVSVHGAEKVETFHFVWFQNST